jgi:cytochrome c553
MTATSCRPRRHLALFAGLASLWISAGAPAAHAAEISALVGKACASCHGVDGNSTDPLIPKLAGIDAAYLAKQLRDYASGARRNESMNEVVATISENDFLKLATYFSTRKPQSGKVSDPALAERGKQLYDEGNSDSGVPACAGCHQADGAGNVRFPRVAGQHAAYSAKQLNDYRNGRRANNPLMSTVGKRLKPDEIKALAEYIAGL